MVVLSIDLRIPERAGPQDPHYSLRAALEQAAADLLGDLGVPQDAAVRIAEVPPGTLRHRGRFDLLVAGKHGRVGIVPCAEAATPGDVAAALFANRALLITDELVVRVEGELEAERPPDGSPAPPPFPGLGALLRRCATLGLSLPKAKAAARHLARLGAGLPGDDYAEDAVLATLLPRTITVDVSPRLYAGTVAPEPKTRERMERDLRDGIFDEFGLRIPKLDFQVADGLSGHSLRVRLHEVRGVLRAVPSNAPDLMLALFWAVAAELRTYATLLLTPALAEATLRRLDPVIPMLVFNALETYPLHMLAEALRLLLAERVSIRNMRAILDAWNGLRTVAPASGDDDTVMLAVSRAPICPPVCPGDGPLTPINARHLAGAARIALRAEITRAVAPNRELRPFLFPRDVIARLREGVLDDDAHAALLEAVQNAVTGAGCPSSPVLLAPPDLRSRVAGLLAMEFPSLRVVSPLELEPSLLASPVHQSSPAT